MNIYELIDNADHLADDARTAADRECFMGAENRLRDLCVYLWSNLAWNKGEKPLAPETKPEPPKPEPEERCSELIRQDKILPILVQLHEIACIGQTLPDGDNCAICGDTDHQAFECHFNAFRVFGKVT